MHRMKELWNNFCDRLGSLAAVAEKFLLKGLALLFLGAVGLTVLAAVTLSTWRALSVFAGWDVSMFDGLAVLISIWLAVWLPIYEGIRRWRGRDPPSLLTD